MRVSWWTLLVVGALACDGPTMIDGGLGHTPEPFEATEATRNYCPADSAEVERRITAALADLSLREKVALITGAGPAVMEGAWRVEGNTRLGLPGLRMLDGPRGLSRFSGFRGTAFPVAAMRGATFDPELERRVGAAIARELRSVGADVLLAPTINLLRHPRWGRAQETYSEDTHHMGEMAVAFIEGAQAQGVLASAKHFAANSIENTRHEVDVVLDDRTLREVYLPHFRRVVQDAQVASIMSAYNRINGDWADMSAKLLTDILRDEWGFVGFVESDWILGTHAGALSLRAGLDIEMPFADRFRRLPSEIAAGELSEHDVDRAVRRVLRAQLCYGLDTRERIADDPDARETTEHLALAREVATRGTVLLSNEGGLPLAPDVSSVVVLGRLADVENIGDEGSSSVTPTRVVTALEGLRQQLGERVVHVPTLDAASEEVVSRADAVVVFTGLLSEDEGEGEIGAGDRSSLALPADEIAVIEAAAALSARVIVVLEGGSAITVEGWADRVEAIAMAFYPGSEGGHAIADILLGAVSPSGRLPFSVPVAEADLPPFDNVSPVVTYGYLHGYRHLAATGAPIRYPFGHGLTYGSFRYGEASVASEVISSDGSIEVRVDVTNDGPQAARETVQLYVAALASEVLRAPRDLRAFAQTVLAPGETATVVLSLEARDLAYWSVERESWVVEALTYEAQVGASATDIRSTVQFRVE